MLHKSFFTALLSFAGALTGALGLAPDDNGLSARNHEGHATGYSNKDGYRYDMALCDKSTFKDLAEDGKTQRALVEDCAKMAKYFRQYSKSVAVGQNWTEEHHNLEEFVPVSTEGPNNCTFGFHPTEYSNGGSRTLIGYVDIAEIMEDSIKQFGGSDRKSIAVEGRMACTSDDGHYVPMGDVIWKIWNANP